MREQAVVMVGPPVKAISREMPSFFLFFFYLKKTQLSHLEIKLANVTLFCVFASLSHQPYDCRTSVIRFLNLKKTTLRKHVEHLEDGNLSIRQNKTNRDI